jgi:glutathione S-transferase
MSFPVLEVSKDFARVEIRRGRGATRWNELEVLYEGPCLASQSWRGEEGEKLVGKHCLWPSDPDSTMSEPYTVPSIEGLDEGRAERLRFPSGA